MNTFIAAIIFAAYAVYMHYKSCKQQDQIKDLEIEINQRFGAVENDIKEERNVLVSNVRRLYDRIEQLEKSMKGGWRL